MAVAVDSQRRLGQQRGRWQRGVLLLLLAVLLIGALAYLGLHRVAYWLVVTDPLAHAQAIVVLDGDLAFRAMEAASLYQQGWAPEVWVTRGRAPAEEAALARLGIEAVWSGSIKRQVLERLGVIGSSSRRLKR